METLSIPTGHQRVMPYLIVSGAADLLVFIQQVFDADVRQKKMRDQTAIMHAEVSFGDSTIMVADSSADWQPQPASLFVYVADADAAYGRAIDRGATVLMAPADKDYGRSAGVMDPFGNVWWITSPG